MTKTKRRCVVCGRTSKLQAHHVVYAQTIRREGGSINDPRAFLTLCAGYGGCHGRFHARSMEIPLGLLRDENYEFAAELFGPLAAYEYLARRYAGSDPRHDALLNAERTQ